MSDNRKRKTPFFKIQIQDASKKRKVTLPHHILRLVQKVEIVEAFQGQGGQSFSNINISILEGSREPASPDSTMGTKGLYNIPSGGQADGISGSVTNRSGLIADLRFSGTGGITWLTEKERKDGKVDTRTQKNVQGKSTTRSHPNENGPPKFLFDARNILTVTIGYLEDPKTIRQFSGYIVNVSTNFSESASPISDIVCLPTGAPMDQVSPGKPITFFEADKISEDSFLFRPKSKKVTTIIDEICTAAKLDCIISDKVDADDVDDSTPRVWAAGTSIQQFLHSLAKATNCYYETRTFPDKPDTVIFISKKDFESRVIIRDRNLLTWRGPGSILKSFRVTADFAKLIGVQKTNINEAGETSSDKVNLPVFANGYNNSTQKNSREQLAPLCPTSGPNPVQPIKSLVEKLFTGTLGEAEKVRTEADQPTKVETPICSSVVEMTPGDNTINNSDSAAIRAEEYAARAITAEFTTVGYTQLSPGVVDIRGVGVRYSGKYRILSTTHTIESGSYTTRCVAQSHAVATGGIRWEEAPKGQENDKVDLQITEGSNVRSKLEKRLGTGKS